jgi:DNA replication protein DnaC
VVDERLGKFVRTSGVPRRFAQLDHGEIDRRGNEVAFEQLDEIADRVAAGDGQDLHLVLTGDFGVGKTRIAVWLLRRAFDWFAPLTRDGADFPRFFAAADLADLRFRSYSGPDDEEDRRDEAREALVRSPFVVIDDVGRVSGYKGEELYLESVVEERWNDGRLATVLTMNELPREGRFADFLKYFEDVPLVGRSHRG